MILVGERGDDFPDIDDPVGSPNVRCAGVAKTVPVEAVGGAHVETWLDPFRGARIIKLACA